ncbi:hypothetical protein Tco_0771204 [Tanacetum coccineum]|uniref:Uncharacterized protein n=1 Tax=Tanacetum coccineum TaxID=301880 RepID=A0ABQ4ZIG8_9ASTR
MTHSINHQTRNSVPEPITAPENIIQIETNIENAQVDDDEFINIFSTPVQERGETLSHYVDSSNMLLQSNTIPSAQRGQKIQQSPPWENLYKSIPSRAIHVQHSPPRPSMSDITFHKGQVEKGLSISSDDSVEMYLTPDELEVLGN